MDPIPSPLFALEELARLLNVWSDQQFVVTSRTALTHWALQTAAFTPRHPRPAVGIAVLTRLGLARVTDNDEFHADDTLRSLMPAPAETHDRFPALVAGNIFRRLLAVPACAASIQQTLPFIRVTAAQLSVTWTRIPYAARKNVAWLWLQQLGLAHHEGSQIVIDPILLPYIVDTLPKDRNLSQSELEARLAVQQARAVLAEEYVLEIERQRLIDCGCPHYAVGVRRISLENVSAGYDIRSFEVTGAARRIEVKSSAGPRDYFFLSRNEYRASRRFGASYWIAWIGWSAQLPHGPCDVAWFRDPAALIKTDGSPWHVSVAQLFIRRIDDDTPFQTAP